jgi:hypothetical protein
MNQPEFGSEVEAIPGNGAVLERLCKLLESGEALGFVGAGASAGLWPLWNEFLEGFVGHALECGGITQEEAEYFRKEAPQTPLETAQQLRNRIGDSLYFEYLQVTFGDKTSPYTGGAFTAAHRALMQLPVHNYITLNYDAGLTNARAALYPRATTSYYSWDQEEASRICDRNYKRQVLHAHGRHDRAASIILTMNDYRIAYANRPFVRLLEHVFAFKKLLIVGFGMNDPYIKHLLNNITADYKKSPLRHVAFVGLDDSDLSAAHLVRERVEMDYGAHVLFYPTRNDHQVLADWLTRLVAEYAKTTGTNVAEESCPLSIAPQLPTLRPDRYVHEPTDDANFKGRAQDFLTLNRWGNDPTTRMIAVTGIGGQGKTALVGRWLKQERSPDLALMPVFWWSFYEDHDVGKLLEQLAGFCQPIGRVYGIQESESASYILSAVLQARLLVVLDGLEVLQEEVNSAAHGEINHYLLTQFLLQWLRYPHQGLMILTSRFRFPQLARYSGVGFHPMDLARLSTADGVALLARLGLRGEQGLMEEYVNKLYGHPLALRVLAGAVKRSCLGDLAQFEGGSILTAAAEEDRLNQKLQHLLSFYERQMENGQKELMGIISLFKRPVNVKSLVTLVTNMKSLQGTPLAGLSAAGVEGQLDLLIEGFLVERTYEGVTTHPVIRDFFRASNKTTGSRREVADFLQTRPHEIMPRSIEEVRCLVEAVHLLCEEGDFEAANVLLRSRLTQRDDGRTVFQFIPAVAEGLECHLAFVGDEARRKEVEGMLGKAAFGHLCSGVALYSYDLGRLAQSLEWWNKCLEIARQRKESGSEAVSLGEIALTGMAMGDIQRARDNLSQAIRLSREARRPDDLRGLLAHKAFCESLLGNSRQAYRDFQLALCYEQIGRPHEQHLYSMWGNEQAEFLVRIQAWERFEAVNAWNIQVCQRNRTYRYFAVCYLLQGWCAICQGQLPLAEGALTQAERILRKSGIVECVCRLDWVWGLLGEAKGDYISGLQRVNDALLTCASTGLRLWQTDLLVLRGRLRLLQFQKENKQDVDLLERAGDDGHQALRLADSTGYAWARLEALQLLASYHQTGVALLAKDAKSDNDSAERYAREADSLKDSLFVTAKQAKESEAQARREFERQISEWGKELRDKGR